MTVDDDTSLESNQVLQMNNVRQDFRAKKRDSELYQCDHAIKKQKGRRNNDRFNRGLLRLQPNEIEKNPSVVPG